MKYIGLLAVGGILLILPAFSSILNFHHEKRLPLPPRLKLGLDARFESRVLSYLDNESATLDKVMLEEMRAGGYVVLDWLKRYYPEVPQTYESYLKAGHAMKLYDQVSGQKDALYSGLFWHKDLKEAMKIAKQEAKPVISLRMLGDFSEDLSCANSRFFRLILYSDPTIAKRLREHFVLHVESVIQVPIITIEYPDGTVQRQTITGNSMHLVMNCEGRVIDALPGLYGPKFFSNWLSLHQGKTYRSTREIDNFRTEYLQLLQNLNDKLNYVEEVPTPVPAIVSEVLPEPVNPEVTIGDSSVEPGSITDTSTRYNSIALPVRNFVIPVINLDILSLTVSKGIIEQPIFFFTRTFGWMYISEEVDALLKNDAEVTYAWLKSKRVDREMFISPALISVKKKYRDNTELVDALQGIGRNVSVENIRNEMNMHRIILEWLGDEKFYSDHKAFTSAVYRELFKTPLDNTKMGLYDPAIFYGITNDGFKP